MMRMLCVNQTAINLPMQHDYNSRIVWVAFLNTGSYMQRRQNGVPHQFSLLSDPSPIIALTCHLVTHFLLLKLKLDFSKLLHGFDNIGK